MLTHFEKSVTFLLIALLGTTAVLSAAIPWRQKSTFQFAQDIPLTDLIRGFAALQGISVVIDKDVKGTVYGKFENLSPQEFLDQIARANDLIWFYNGSNVLYVYPSQKVESKFLEVSPLATEKLLETISNLGIVAPGSSMRVLAQDGLAFVSGPPEYISLVSQIADRLNKTSQVQFSESPKIKIFPLKYAWAYDNSITTQDTTITIPGVANVLRGLMQSGQAPGVVVSGLDKKGKVQVAEKVETFKQKNNLVSEQNKEIPKENLEKKNNEAKVPQASGATLIQPDIRLNAVIVRDVEERMPQYAEIIKTLDVPVQIVEISVAILDINSNYSNSLGNNFFSATNLNDSNKYLSFNTNSSKDGVTAPTSGFNIQGGAVYDAYKIISQVNALASNGHANIVSRPSILTLNNIEATISKSDTFYVQLQGKDASDLANVTTGTTLKVTPRVIEESRRSRKIKLLVSIEDGSVDTASTATTTLPRTSNNTVHTQAVINEGQSLLVGGYYRQEQGISETGIPILRSIPLLGYAFKIKKKTNDTIERMYLITPRIINLHYEEAPDMTPHFDNVHYGSIARKNSQDNYERTHLCDYAREPYEHEHTYRPGYHGHACEEDKNVVLRPHISDFSILP